jgi:hypothetical protein
MPSFTSLFKKAEHLAISASVLAVIALAGMGVLGLYEHHALSVARAQVSALSLALSEVTPALPEEESSDTAPDMTAATDEDTP